MPSWLLRVLGEDVEDQRDAVDDVDLEQLLEVALLRGRELVVEHDEVDVERLGELLQLLRLARTDVGGGVGRVASLQHELDRIGARGVDEQRELVERRLRGFGVARADAGADEQRALPEDVEIGLGCGEPPATHAARVGAPQFEIDLDVEDVHDRAAEADGVAPSSTVRSPPGTCTVTRSPTSPRWCATAAVAHAPVPQLSVSPTPRSHTRMSTSSVAPGVTRTNSTLVRFGKRSSTSRCGPCCGDARGGGVVDEQHEVRVAHAGGVALVVGAVEVGGDAERASRARPGSARGRR